MSEVRVRTHGIEETPASPPGDAARRYQFIALGLAASDALALIAALLTSYFVRFGVISMPLDLALVILAAPFLWVAVFQGFHLYAPHRLSAPEEFRRVLGATSVGMVLIVLVTFWSESSFSRGWVGLTWLFALVFELTARQAWRSYVRKLNSDGRLALRTLLVGTSEEGQRLGSALREPGTGFGLLGYVRASSPDGGTDEDTILGDLPRLHDVIREHAIDCVFVASSALDDQQMSAVIKAARQAGVDLWVSTNLPQVLATRLTAQPIGRTMIVSVSPVKLTGPQALAKRAFDLSLSTLVLAVALPLWLLIAAAIWLSSRGPVLFRQERVGREGKTFRMFKFRTMVSAADSQRDGLAALNEAAAPLFKIRRDPRVTAVGRWLRRWSLDELPQLLNVLKGEMSLVGPRPAIADEVNGYELWHYERLEALPGITGLWQTSGRSTLAFDDYVRLDLFYIENWSLAFDLFILAKTLPVILRGRGAY